MYYLARTTDQNGNGVPTEYEIRTVPGETNMSGEPRVTGWLGTTNNRRHDALGDFDTILAARQAAIADTDSGFATECEDDRCCECDGDDDTIVHLIERPCACRSDSICSTCEDA